MDEKSSRLSSMLERGDVYYNIQGSTPDEAISALVKVVRLPKGVDRTALREALIEREHLCTTAIGEGFALPHSRKQMAPNEESAFVALGYLDSPVDWKAPDGKPVTALFLMLSAGVQNHLIMLSGIACLVAKKEFRAFAAKKPSKSDMIDYLKTMKC